ncbi:restriction endonuclease subunit S [Raoultella planticola]|uniref:restriction endonuclease subunit S n=1 Tax=Raoultella planticola TaxID=575 RepID=UPI0038241410
MGSKWATVSIDDIKSPEKYSCVGGPFGSSLSQKHYVDSGVPVIRGTNLAGDIFSESGFVFVSPDKANELQRNMAFRGDIVFTQRGTLGQVALIPEDSIYERYIVSQSQMKLTVNPKQADAYFIYTYFRTNEAKALIENNAIVGGVPHINLGILKEFKLRLPPLSEQKRISEVSKSIDNKINLNRQINQTLEQMSQTLFKSWFVDFDPVIDNALDAGNPIPEALQSRAELRQKVRNSVVLKQLPTDIRALFPAEFEETELGYVPKGWVTNRLENILELAYGKALKKTERTNGDYPVYGSGGVDGTHNEYLIKGPGIIVGRKGTVGSLHWENKDFYPIDTVFFVKPKEYYSLVYCYQLLKTLGLENMNTDAAVPGLNRNNAYRLEVVTPTQSIITKFTNIIQTIQHKMDSNHNETENLTALRDTLLPKLLSGELSLEDLPNLIAQTEPA